MNKGSDFSGSELSGSALAKLYPCFFIGISIVEGKMNAAVAQSVKKGRFFTEHKFEGRACSSANLFGAFFPVFSLPNERIREGLVAISKKFHGEDSCFLHPYWQTTPQHPLPGIRELREDMAKLVPLEIADVRFPDGTAEAYIKILDPGALLKWLQDMRFGCVASVRDEREPALMELRCSGIAEFAGWLGSEKFQVSAESIVGAFLYENSD
jgi:hypothetical protein